MPTLELAAGQVVTAAHTNTYWMRQVIATGLSSARPTGYQGRAVYDTDTHRLMIYASATTGWRAPWNLPWGHMGHTCTSTDIIVSNTSTPVTPGLNVPVTMGRLIRITGGARYGWPGFAGGIGTVHWTVSSYLGAGLITTIGSTTLMGKRFDANAADAGDQIFFSYLYQCTGTGNLGLQGNGWAASLTMNYYAGAWINVEDVGPATSPP